MELSDKAKDWERIHAARAAGTVVRAVSHVERTLLKNRGYLGALGENELANLIVNNLVADGWSLTPPKESDDRPEVSPAGSRRAGSPDGPGAPQQS